MGGVPGCPRPQTGHVPWHRPVQRSGTSSAGRRSRSGTTTPTWTGARSSPHSWSWIRGASRSCRCSQKRAAFYLKKGFARPLRDGVLQFTDDQTEKRMRELYEGPFSPSSSWPSRTTSAFVAARPTTFPATHVVPRATLEEVTAALAAVSVEHPLSVPGFATRRYEQAPEPDPEFAGDWQEYAGPLEAPFH